LPRAMERGYSIRSEGPVRLILVTFLSSAKPGDGWGGFAADVERQGELTAGPENRPA
jgi:hypothetical protein